MLTIRSTGPHDKKRGDVGVQQTRQRLDNGEEQSEEKRSWRGMWPNWLAPN